MESSEQMANRFREVILNGTWIANTNYKAQLADVDWVQATTKIASFNTIAALTSHVHYYIAGILNVLEGGSLAIRDQYSFDFPPITSQEDWEKVLSRFWEDSEKFAHLVEQLSESMLKESFTDRKYGSYQRNIEGMIEHSYYHLGQIVLVKKMTQEIHR
ncbi:DinB family protein [Flavobacterium humi]|uniref:DUF1572 domain-containing protein n=1 Tax=Flavobacterium humi TaxID=2562683 RepID=A0A4Z0L6Y5_9FLAO|nr:DinB family protein [Flavobacterium humi]TGD58001.1 DUF1572 domain-containing protein [Flavobacterium humi]